MIGVGKRGPGRSGRPGRPGRFFRFRGAAVLLLVLLIACFGAPVFCEDTRPFNEESLERISVADPDDFTFAVFGDAQEGTDVFPMVLDMIERDPDITFAVAVGDLVNTGSDEEYDAVFRLLRERLTKPLLWVAGNHEYMAGGKPRYEARVGPVDFSFVVGDVTFVMMDGAGPSRPSNDRVAWLEQELSRAAERRGMCLVFLHRPLFDPRGEGYAEALDEAWAGELLGLFRTYRVHHVFCGHVHGSFNGRWDGVPFTVTGGAGGTLDGDDPNIYFYHYLKANVSGNALRIGAVRVPVGGGPGRIVCVRARRRAY
jgi:3',5'-cyclic AMP phosphodiesterase CpdA